MAGVTRSSINLTRWRGAVPNVLNAGRVDAVLGTAAVTDVQAGLAKESSSQSIWNQMTGVGVNVADKASYDTAYWRGHLVSGAVVNGFIPVYIPAFQANTVTVSSFLDAWSEAELLALEELAEQHSEAGRRVRILFRRLLVNTIVDVPQVRALVERLQPALVAAGIWTPASAATRIRALFTPPVS